MRIEVSQEKIKKAISIAEHITGKNLTLPVLSSILITARERTLEIRSTNLDIGIEISIPAKIESEGIVAIPGAILNNLLGNIFDTTVRFKTNKDNLEISTKNTSTIIKSVPHDDFPTLPAVKDNNPIIISAEKAYMGFKAVAFSASSSDIKPEIASVCMFARGGELVFVATDSFRLAEKRFEFKTGKEFDPIIIPIKNVLEIIRVLDGIFEDIEIHVNKNQISFRTPSLYLTSRVVDGIFPDYEQIIPRKHTTDIIVLKQDFLNALRLSNLFADKFNQITITIHPQKKNFQVRARNFDVGENVAHIEATLEGDPLELNFNYKYILDCLQSISKDSLNILGNGEGKPLIIRGAGDKSFTYLVMPLNQ